MTEQHCKHEHCEIFLADSAREIKKRLEAYLTLAKLGGLSPCPLCGGLTPELFFFLGKENAKLKHGFAFTCHLIEEFERVETSTKEGSVEVEVEYKKSKTLHETDYEKFLKYLQAKEAKKKLSEAK